MTVLYYVNTYYLDAALETILALKKAVTLHVLIEIAPESKRSNIINVDSLEDHNLLENPEALLPDKTRQLLASYLEGVTSFKFIIFKSRKNLSGASIQTTRALWKFISRCEPDVIHFDSISTRLLLLYPLIRRKNIFITVHDPLPHTGEGSWKLRFVERLYFGLARRLFFYSKFAASQFRDHHAHIKARQSVLRFQPFSFIRRYTGERTGEGEAIVFFGRILAYKGVDLLLAAIPEVVKKYPEQKFIIAGEPFHCELDTGILEKYQKNIRLVPGYISVEELSAIIRSAKFIVCPYRDATQSGVVMTSYAFGKMVVGTNVGAFPEYIIDGVNGILTEPDSLSIARDIIRALDGDYYRYLEKNIHPAYSEETGLYNRKCLLDAYEEC